MTLYVLHRELDPVICPSLCVHDVPELYKTKPSLLVPPRTITAYPKRYNCSWKLRFISIFLDTLPSPPLVKGEMFPVHVVKTYRDQYRPWQTWGPIAILVAGPKKLLCRAK